MVQTRCVDVNIIIVRKRMYANSLFKKNNEVEEALGFSVSPLKSCFLSRFLSEPLSLESGSWWY